MQTLSFSAVFLAALVYGTPHCAAMCGGFVAFYAGKSDNRWISHLAYNLGRLVTYLLLGAAAGLLGKSLDRAGMLLGFQRATALVTGGLLLVWGLQGLLGRSAHSGLANRIIRAVTSLTSLLHKRALSANASPWVLNAFLLGLLSTFLPCGFLYTFTALAAAEASPLGGAALMFFFWLGTVPVMTALGTVLQTLSTPLRRFVPRLSSALLIAAGLFALSAHTIARPADSSTQTMQGCPMHHAAN